ncbi:unnamed protein product [Penicillium salamii]|nr:unnamed protein product [Penicillium salamii]
MGVPSHLAEWLGSDGSWRLLVFSGDQHQPQRVDCLAFFADTFRILTHLAHSQPTQPPERLGPIIGLLLIHDFHSFADVMGWGYWKVFADDRDQIYMEYAIIRQRWIFWPGRHVAWIGDMEDTAVLNTYFSNFFRSR